MSIRKDQDWIGVVGKQKIRKSSRDVSLEVEDDLHTKGNSLYMFVNMFLKD